MIAEAFSFVQFPILPLVKAVDADDSTPVQMFRRNPKLCTPSDFDYSPYFEIIKYPFVGFTHSQDYHLLPWDGTGELSAKESELYIGTSLQPTPEVVDEVIANAVRKADGSALTSYAGAAETAVDVPGREVQQSSHPLSIHDSFYPISAPGSGSISVTYHPGLPTGTSGIARTLPCHYRACA